MQSGPQRFHRVRRASSFRCARRRVASSRSGTNRCGNPVETSWGGRSGCKSATTRPPPAATPSRSSISGPKVGGSWCIVANPRSRSTSTRNSPAATTWVSGELTRPSATITKAVPSVGWPANGSSAPRYRDGARAVAPLAVAVLGFGISFGLLARSAGMGWLAPIVMSATTFAGSAQFAAVSILGAGGTVAAVAAAVLLNLRYGPIGVSVAPWLDGPAWWRFLRAQLVVDESWALAAEGEGRFDPGILVGAGLLLYVSWVAGTAIGVLGGQALGDPKTLGLDAAFPALFLALLLLQLRNRRTIVAAILGGAIALALTPVAPAGVPIIAASAACLIGLARK